ncbi:LCP family protein [Haloechinothrix halophila]|uniref:LCP family protein n=1 Tax=Haloechinothrix halophila TaxID=1069073 RepID=UPI000426E67D|nr:LCP family protein [Haloechinothrix halophila]
MHAGKPQSRTRRLAALALRTCVALLSLTVLAVAGYADVILGSLRESVTSTPALDRVPDTPTKPDDAIDILLVGTDSRTDAQGNPLPPETLQKLRTGNEAGVRTDTIIILRLPGNGDPAHAVSIPRDSWVDVPTGGKAKITAAFNLAKQAEIQRLRDEGIEDQAFVERQSDEAGRQALVRTVQNFVDIRIDHYAEVSLLGFYLLTEAIGGVDVCLKNPVHDPKSGASFPAGHQTISGSDALAFVRQRHNLSRGDLDRIVRQQVFLGSALNKVLSAGTLTNPAKLSQLLAAVRQSVVLDEDLDVLEFVQRLRGLAAGDVEFVTIPVVTITGRSPDGQSIVEVDVEEVREFVHGLVDGPPESVPGEDGGDADAEPGNDVDATTTPANPDAPASPAATAATATPDAPAPADSSSPTGQSTQPAEPISADDVPCVN